jgi:hypothetical protein
MSNIWLLRAAVAAVARAVAVAPVVIVPELSPVFQDQRTTRSPLVVAAQA